MTAFGIIEWGQNLGSARKLPGNPPHAVDWLTSTNLMATSPFLWRPSGMSAPTEKRFSLSVEEIRPLATGRGGAIATDRITVNGCPVGFMYRLAAEYEWDSGWVFNAGDVTPVFSSSWS